MGRTNPIPMPPSRSCLPRSLDPGLRHLLVCSLSGDILCEELARQLAGIRPLHAEQKERDSWVFLTGFSDARRSLGSNQYHQPPTALATRDTSQLTPTNRRYSATATC